MTFSVMQRLPSQGRRLRLVGVAFCALFGVVSAGCSPSAKVSTRAGLAPAKPAPAPVIAKTGPRRTLVPKLAARKAIPPRRAVKVRRKTGGIRLGGGYAKIGKPYRIGKRRYVPKVNPNYDQTGTASWYGTAFHAKMTANGEYFDMNRLSAAHPTLPLPSFVQVTNLANGRTVVVRVNDRGPYAHNRLIDLSRAVARHLAFEHLGTARVRVRYIGAAPLNGDVSYEEQFLARQPWHRRAVASN